MSIAGQPPTPQRPDTWADAVEAAQQDYARLTRGHEFSWSVDLSMGVLWRCSCSPDKPRNSGAADVHILTAIRSERGPVRAPRKK